MKKLLQLTIKTMIVMVMGFILSAVTPNTATAQDCCTGSISCSSSACIAAVAVEDSWCSSINWDGLCAGIAVANANASGPCAGVGNCPGVMGCAVTPPACVTDQAAYDQIVASDTFCCNNSWDASCQNNYDALSSSCTGGGGGIPEGTWEVTVDVTSLWGDEITWSLQGTSGTLASGGPYGQNPPTDVQSVLVDASDEPVTFSYNSDGFFGDNAASVTIECSEGEIYSNTFPGGSNTTIGGLTCGGEPPVEYCAANFSNPDYEYISNVSYAGINNSTAGIAGLNNYTYLTANVTQGQTDVLSVTIQADLSEYIYAFIDWNQNGTLNDAGEVYTLASATSSNGPHTMNISVPGAAAIGNTRMRVMLDYGTSTPDPCAQDTYGEVEDYTVNVQAGGACAGTPAPGNTLANVASVCTGGSVNLSLQNASTGSGISYQWQSSPDNSVWSNFGANASTATASLSSDTWYRAIVSCDGNDGVSNPVLVSINNSGCYCVNPLCEASSTILDGDYITYVEFAGIQNSSGESGYADYRCEQGAVTGGDVVSFYSEMYSQFGGTVALKAYIDWNQNNTFDAGEVYEIGSGNLAAGVITADYVFYVPVDAVPGTTLVRLVFSYGGYFDDSGCGTFTYGEVEDYSLLVEELEILCDVPTLSTSSVDDCMSGTYQLFLDIANDGDASSYDVYLGSVNSGPYCDEAQSPISGFSADLACQDAVCANDAFCCNNQWDFQCASAAASLFADECAGCLSPASANVTFMGTYSGGTSGIDLGTHAIADEITITVEHNDDFLCTQVIEVTNTSEICGCMDPAANNYNPAATSDDGSCILPPANDDCTNAVNLSVPTFPSTSNALGSIYGANNEGDAGCVGSVVGGDVFYTFTLANENHVGVTVNPFAGADLVVEVLDGCAGTTIACIDNAGDAGIETVLLENLAAGTYLIRVHSWYADPEPQATANFLINVQQMPYAGVQNNPNNILYACNQTGFQLEDFVGATPQTTPWVLDYQWLIGEVGGGLVNEWQRGEANYSTRISWLGMNYGSTYNVFVRVLIDHPVHGEIWTVYPGDYSNPNMPGAASCTITTSGNVTPTEVRPNFTPTTPAGNDYTMCDVATAYNVQDSENFRWRFDQDMDLNNANEIYYTRGSGNPSVRLSWVSGLVPGITYNVAVEVQVNGQWSGYSTIHPMSIALPPNDITLRPGYCGGTYAPNGYILSESVCEADFYTFEFVNTVSGSIHTRNLNNYVAFLNGVSPALTPGDYNVRVKVTQNGVPGDFGPSCVITISGSGMAEEGMAALRNIEATGSATLFPNPNAGSEVRVSLDGLSDGSHDVNIVIYDIYGKMISTEAFGHEGTQLSRLVRFDGNLSTGMYMVQILVDGEQFATERLIVQ